MFKKSFKIAAAAITASMSLASMCFASAELTSLNGRYTIQAKNEIKTTGNMFSISVKDSSGDSAHESYTYANEQGNFSYSFSLGDRATGDYYLTVVASDGAKLFDNHLFRFASETDKQNTYIPALNAATTAAAAEAALNDCIYYGIVSLPTGFTLSSSALSGIYGRIAATNDFTVDNLSAKMSEIFAVEALKNATADNVSAVIEEYSEVYNFSNERYYSLYQKEGRSAVVDKMFTAAQNSQRLTSLAAIRTVFNEVAVLSEWNSMVSQDTKLAVLTSYQDVFPANVLAYTNKAGLARVSIGKTVNSMAELSGLIASVPAEVTPGGGGSTGGGGGGGGASGGSPAGGSTSVSLGNTNVANMFNQKTFADIKNAEWARTAIEALIKRSVINGYETGDFKPNSTITREEFVKIIIGAFGISGSGKDCGFSDIGKSHWAYSYICTAKEKGIVSGVSESSFGAGSNITRQDMAVIIVNAMKAAGKNSFSTEEYDFADKGSISGYAKEAVFAMKNLNIIGGYEDKSFKPQNSATRAEAAQMIYNSLKALGKI